MKKILSGVFAAASIAAFATAVESDNTFGLMKVTVPSGVGEVIVGVPWVAVGGGDIVPTNLVTTTGLAEDDWLFYFDNGKFDGWKVMDGVWTAALISDGTHSSTYYQSGLGGRTSARGQALIVKTAQPYVYLSGQYANNTAGETEVTAGKWNLIAPSVPSDSYIDLNGEGIFSGTPAEGDFIIEGGHPSRHYTYKAGEGWGYESTAVQNPGWQLGLTVPQGTGIWYVSTTNSYDSVPKFTW